ncbi:MAG: hypothetical protein N3C13_03550 [Aquificaceae bacterium]|nr:hypothetical protein [Aquificaceae bacterium]MCX8060255.1 hypothetical protein [Aquificaceae bacterium]MDW8097412.1 hypothetical protein [Aquificaceae bacterium]
MQEEQELRQESLEEQVEELKRDASKFVDFCLPPKEVRQEILKNLRTIELSFLRIVKALVDYEVSKLEQKLEKKQATEKVKKIEVE